MNFRASKVAVLGAALLMSSSAGADNSFWVGGKVGTLGLGLEGIWRPIKWLDLRLGGSRYDYRDSGGLAGINYDATLRLSSYYATANLRFPLSPFRISAGMYSNQNGVELISLDSSAYRIGDTVFTAADVGTIRSETSFNSTSPYLGAGFDFSLVGKVGMNLDFGVLWQGDPKVSLTTDGLLANDPTFLAQLEAERAELEDEVSPLKAYPVVSLGFNFSF